MIPQSSPVPYENNFRKFPFSPDVTHEVTENRTHGDFAFNPYSPMMELF